jgi:hypothetical protein
MNTHVVGTVVSTLLIAAAHGQVVFENTSDNGYFTPFNTANAGVVKYGDSGWLGFVGDGTPTFTVNQITLYLATAHSDTPGSTDVVFTFNNGDPSGLVFGPGTPFYTVTIPCVQLPAAPTALGPYYFELTIPLPSITTTGGFNNIGWSVALQNFSYAGDFGFQVGTANGQLHGFYTNNASYYNGSAWSLFAFSQDPNTGVANYVAKISSAQLCFADLDGGSGDGVPDGGVDINDLLYFLGAFERGGPAADLDNGSGTGTRDCGVDINDLLFFLGRFENGC